MMDIPPQYDHPTKLPVIEWKVSATQIESVGRFCGHHIPDKIPFGCAQIYEGKCYVWLMLPGGAYQWSTPTLAEVRRHEIAHCNGWVHESGD